MMPTSTEIKSNIRISVEIGQAMSYRLDGEHRTGAEIAHSIALSATTRIIRNLGFVVITELFDTIEYRIHVFSVEFDDELAAIKFKLTYL